MSSIPVSRGNCSTDPGRVWLTSLSPTISRRDSPASSGRWPSRPFRIIETLDLLSADMLLLLPARITRRKNIEYAVKTLADLRRLSHKDCRLIVTGPPGAHNPANIAHP